jgi:hypothetical protein
MKRICWGTMITLLYQSCMRSADKIKTTIKGLKSGKTYYFKVRAYKKTADGTILGSFSTVKSAKIK